MYYIPHATAPAPPATAPSSTLALLLLSLVRVCIVASGRSGLDLVDQERSSNSVLIQDYPGHESLWCYRRFLCQTFLVAAPREALLCTPPTVEHRHQQQRQQQQQQQQQPDDHRAQDCHDTGLTTAGGGGVTPDEQGMAVSTPAPVPVPVAEGDGALATAAGDRYDWPRWNRAVAEWYETCVRADADEENSVEGEEDSDEGEEDTEESGEEDEHDGTGDLVEGGATDLSGVPGGELPGSIAGGGMLEEFLGREACFALKCATDQVGHRRLGTFLFVCFYLFRGRSLKVDSEVCRVVELPVVASVVKSNIFLSPAAYL